MAMYCKRTSYFYALPNSEHIHQPSIIKPVVPTLSHLLSSSPPGAASDKVAAPSGGTFYRPVVLAFGAEGPSRCNLTFYIYWWSRVCNIEVHQTMLCVHVRHTYVYTYMYPLVHTNKQLCLYIYTYTYTYIYIHRCTHNTHINICRQVCTSMYLYVYIYIYVYVYVCVYVCVYSE